MQIFFSAILLEITVTIFKMIFKKSACIVLELNFRFVLLVPIFPTHLRDP